jgi:hypothetical protein
MRPSTFLKNGLIGVTALVSATTFVDRARSTPEVAMAAPVATYVTSAIAKPDSAAATAAAPNAVSAEVDAALDALKGSVRRLSSPAALEDAFKSYFAFKAAHPEQVKKPYLYFVDYGLSNTTPRGYVFDMDKLAIVDGPFMVAHGRGSSKGDGVPTHFSNGFGAATTSLGLYVAQELYNFVGHTGGATYSSIGLRLQGVSKGFNDNARARGVVAHGAPYVTPSRAGRSEGCPAVEPARAQTLLPKLANGAMVFLFAPDHNWMTNDPWLTGTAA